MAIVTVEKAEPGAESPKPPPRDAGLMQTRASLRDSLISELEQAGRAERDEIEQRESGRSTEEEAETPAEPEEKPEPKKKPPVEDDDEPADDGDGDSDDEDDEEVTESKSKDEKKPDKELDKRLEQIRRTERKSREKLTAERDEFRREKAGFEAKVQPLLQKVQEFEALSKRARSNLPAVLRSLGLTDDDFEPAAKVLYEESPAGKNDPKVKARTGAQALRAREQEDQLSELTKQVQQLTRSIQERDEQAELQRHATTFLDNVQKQMNGETPLLSRLLDKNASRYRAHIAAVTQRLVQETDEIPDIDDVLAEAEKARREQLEDEGIDVEALLGKAAPAATESEKKGGKTLQGGGGAPPPKPKSKQSRKELEKDVLARLRAGNLDDD